MALKLEVPYNDKDKVKALGAFWNSGPKVWTIPDHVKDINPFKTWIPMRSDVIVRKPYLLCISKTNCWKCSKETPMIALAARNFFFLDDQDNGTHWIRATWPTLFRYVTGLEENVLAYLTKLYPFFREKDSRTAEGSYFANTCTTCGSLQGDFHNHEDFGGAFLHDPYKPAPSHVKLITLDIPYDYQIDAQHGSMAYNPIFFPNKIQNAGNQIDKIRVIIF